MSQAITPPDPPACTINAIVHRLGAEAVANKTNQRDESRVAVHAPAQLGLIKGQPALDASGPAAAVHFAAFKSLFEAWITDLSPMGLGMLTGRDLCEYEALWVNLEDLADEKILMPVRIIYSNRLLARTYRVGVVFL